ncbi:MAG: tyrosine-type recombinase/integrase [Deltaproteobacteria bacterium]|nr:MAG: tyrosine-type recombinase/integrase [Deltaproteobacteria bacterium]
MASGGFSVEKLQAFLARVPDTAYPFFLMAAPTGLRVGELLALEWSDIDFENRYSHWMPGEHKAQVDELDNLHLSAP